MTFWPRMVVAAFLFASILSAHADGTARKNPASDNSAPSSGGMNFGKVNVDFVSGIKNLATP
jgi:hypothetical protein